METTIPGLKFDLVPSIILIFVCIIMVALLASSEAGILSVNKIRIKNMENNGDRKAIAISELLRSHDRLFATILTVENGFIILSSSVSATLAHNMFGEVGTIVASLIMTILIVIFGEITPKTFAAQNSEFVALNAALPIKMLVRICTYPVFILTSCTKLLLYFINKLGFGSKEALHYSITEGEIRMMIDEGHLHQSERELLQNVFEFGDAVVGHVMTPRTMIHAIPKNYTIREALLEMVTYGYSKFPVYEESLDNIVGIVYLKELIGSALEINALDTETIDKFVRPAIFIPESKKIRDILKMMQLKRVQIFIVTDEYGGTEGLVTVEDLVEQIVGDMSEEVGNTDEKDVETVDEKTFVLSGITYIEDIREEIGLDIPEGNYQTIAGFVLQELGKIPTAGEKFVYKNLEIIVSEVVGPKILKVTIIKH